MTPPKFAAGDEVRVVRSFSFSADAFKGKEGRVLERCAAWMPKHGDLYRVKVPHMGEHCFYESELEPR